MRRVAFIVNPIAGMGGRVGLKGTDGVLLEAIRRGAVPRAWKRGREFLLAVEKIGAEVLFVTPAGDMGERCFEGLSLEYEVIEGNFKFPSTSRRDTIKCVEEAVKRGVSLVIFVGGDGTARDVSSASGKVPILGIPAGVKMYSSVFVETPAEGAYVLREFLERGEVREGEIVDIDEEAFRRDSLSIKVYGYCLTPKSEFLQGSKSLSYGEEDKKAIAEYFYEGMFDPSITYILGPGSTVFEIKRRILGGGTLLGVDMYVKGEKLFDVWEKQILSSISFPCKIIISPIGGQGFIFGRGNLQISPEVIKRVGPENVIVISSKDKLLGINALRVDTGDPSVDKMFPEFVRVLTGYGEWKLMKVKRGSL